MVEKYRTGNARSLFAIDFLGRGFNSRRLHQIFMTIKAIVHKAEEGGYWAEVPSIPGCATQGETLDELLENLRDAIEGCLSVDVGPADPGGDPQIIEVAV